MLCARLIGEKYCSKINDFTQMFFEDLRLILWNSAAGWMFIDMNCHCKIYIDINYIHCNDWCKSLVYCYICIFYIIDSGNLVNIIVLPFNY